MLPLSKKRVRLSMDEKNLILNHRKENRKITQKGIRARPVEERITLELIHQNENIFARAKKVVTIKGNVTIWGVNFISDHIIVISRFSRLVPHEMNPYKDL